MAIVPAASIAPRLALAAQRRPWAAALALAAVLLKVRIVGLAVFTGVVAAYVAARGQVAPADVLLFALAGTLGAGGAAVLNHYLDRDLDARMARTRRRPLPAGQMPPAAALLLGLGLLGLSLPVALAAHPTLPLFIGAGAVVYVLVYTWWLKRRTPHSVVLGGWTGSCAVLGGWAMTGAPLTLAAWGLALVVFFWTPPHFWGLALVRGADYRAAGIPTLPAVAGEAATARAIALGAALTLLASLVPWLTGDLGAVYGVVALAGGGLFVGQAVALCLPLWLRPWRTFTSPPHSPSPRAERSPKATRPGEGTGGEVGDAAGTRGDILRQQVDLALAWRTYKLSGLYLLALFVAMLVDVAVR